MTKGLPRSLGRADPDTFGVIKKNIALSGVVEVTGADATVESGTFVAGDFPQGNILILGAVAYATIDVTNAEMIADWAGDYAIGTAGVADGALSGSGEANIIAATAVTADSGLKIATGVKGLYPNSTNAMTPLLVDNTDGSLEINFNFLLDDDQVTDTEAVDVTVTGSLHIAYMVLGDD